MIEKSSHPIIEPKKIDLINANEPSKSESTTKPASDSYKGHRLSNFKDEDIPSAKQCIDKIGHLKSALINARNRAGINSSAQGNHIQIELRNAETNLATMKRTY